jgi:uncharacterized protein (TIGR03067 family)
MVRYITSRSFSETVPAQAASEQPMAHAVVMLLWLVSMGASGPGDLQETLERLQGTWVLTSLEGEGLPSGVHVGLVFNGDKYHGLRNGTIDERGTIKLDIAAGQMAIDLVISEGKYAGKTQLGLVNIAGDSMTLVLAEPGATVRPAALTQSPLGLTKLRPIPKPLEGTWEGTIDANGKALRVVVKLSPGPDGLGTGTLASLDQGTAAAAPIVAVVQIGSRIKLIVPSLRGTYDGELKEGQLTGVWSQGRITTPLVLARPK